MMRSLFSGVAGLRTHQTRMDVIGNNIANVNTVAYKSSSVTFQDLLYQTTQNASGANAATGRAGINAKQIGLGVSTGSISTNITGPGSAQNTGSPFDIRITGDSFFVVSDGGNQFYTRAGAFNVDANGTLAMATNGYTVMGYGTTTDTNGELVINTAELVSLDIMSDENKISPPIATNYTYGSGILDKNSKSLTTTQGQMMGVPFYDNLGYSYTAQFKIERENGPQSEDTGQYKLTMVDITDSKGKSIFKYTQADVGKNVGGHTVTAEDIAAGSKYTITQADVDAGTQWKPGGGAQTAVTAADVGKEVTSESAVVGQTYGRIKVTASDVDKEYKSSSEKEAVLSAANVFTTGSNMAYMVFDTFMTDPAETPAGKLMEVTGTKATARVATPQTSNVNGDPIRGLGLNLGGLNNFAPGFAGMNNDQNAAVAIDLSEVQNIDNKGSTTVNGKKGHIDSDAGAGCAAGEMSSISIGQDGKITASYTNGQSKLLGQIASATFANAAGLEKTGDNLYRTTLNSGEAVINDITANGGSMSTGELEMSNVDLSAEFTDMITTQRGFQANSRIITVSDSMLEELVNLKR